METYLKNNMSCLGFSFETCRREGDAISCPFFARSNETGDDLGHPSNGRSLPDRQKQRKKDENRDTIRRTLIKGKFWSYCRHPFWSHRTKRDPRDFPTQQRRPCEHTILRLPQDLQRHLLQLYSPVTEHL